MRAKVFDRKKYRFWACEYCKWRVGDKCDRTKPHVCMIEPGKIEKARYNKD